MAIKGISQSKVPGMAARAVSDGRARSPKVGKQGVPVQNGHYHSIPLAPSVHPQSAANTIARFARTSQDFHAAHRRDAHEHLAELVLHAPAETATTTDEILESTVSRLVPVTVAAEFLAWRTGYKSPQDSVFIESKWHELGDDRLSVSAWLHEAARDGVRPGLIHDFIRFLSEAGLVKLTTEQASLIAKKRDKRVIAHELPEAALNQASAFSRWLSIQRYTRNQAPTLVSRLQAVFTFAGADWGNISVVDQLIGQMSDKVRANGFRVAFNRYREFVGQTKIRPHQSLLENFEDWLQDQGLTYRASLYHGEKIADALATIAEDSSYEEVLDHLEELARQGLVHGGFAPVIFRRFASFMKATERVAEISSGLKARFADDPDGPIKKRLLKKFYRWMLDREKYPKITAHTMLYHLSFLLTETGSAWRHPSQLMQQASQQNHVPTHKTLVRIFYRFLFDSGHLKKLPSFVAGNKREWPGTRNMTPVSNDVQVILESFDEWLHQSRNFEKMKTVRTCLSVLRRASRELGASWQDPQALIDWAAQAKTPAMKSLNSYCVRLFLQFLTSP